MLSQPMTLSQKVGRAFSEYVHNLRSFSRNARLFLLGTFFMGMGFSGFMLLFNLYLKEFGFLEGRIGNIISATTFGVVIMAIPASIILRRFPVKRILIMATPVAAFSYLVQVTASHYYIIMAGGMLGGFASVFFRVAAAPFFMRNSTAKERPYLFSFQFAFMLVAGIIGNVLGGFLPGVIETYGFIPLLAYRYTLYIFGTMVLIGIIPYLMIHEKHAVPAEEELKLSASRLIIVKLFLPVLVVGIGAGLSIPFFNLYFKHVFQTPTKLIGIFYSLQQFLMIAGLLLAPVIAERFGKIRTVVFSQLISIPFLITLGITHNLTLAVIAFLVRATLMNMAQPLFTNFAMEKVAHEQQPFMSALLVIAWTAGWGASASIGGYLIEHFSYTVPFFTTSACYLISTYLLFTFFRHK
jgi:predicted MFS family arabinose efflux permease